MGIRAERLAVLAGVETTYGVDVTPTAATQLRDVTVDPIEGEEVEVGVIRPGFGGQVTSLFGRHCSLKGKILLGSSGTLGTPPAWGWLARCTGHAQTITASTKVEYTPVDAAFESASVYCNLEGNRTRLLGVRGNIIWRWVVGQYPEAEFDLLGLFDADASVSFPAVNYSAWKTPPLVGKATVPLFQIGAADEVMQSLEINAGITRDYVNRVNREDIDIGDRKASITALFEEPAFSARNYNTSAGVPGTYKSLAMTHGTADGAKILASATNWQHGKPRRQRIGNHAGIQLTGQIIPASATPDYKITVQ